MMTKINYKMLAISGLLLTLSVLGIFDQVFNFTNWVTISGFWIADIILIVSICLLPIILSIVIVSICLIDKLQL